MIQNNYKFFQNFINREDLKLYDDNALLLYSLQIRYGIENIIDVAASALVDGNNDKKTDIIYIDYERKEAVIGQGYYSSKESKEAPANKASDLNTSVSWLLTRNIDEIPIRLREAAKELRSAIIDNEIDRIVIWYSHNLPESKNVKNELMSVENTLNSVLKTHYPSVEVSATSLEIGLETLEKWYIGLTTPILVTDTIELNNTSGFQLVDKENKWESFTTAIPATKLYQLYLQHGTDLFSANVRDYLGSRKSDSNINNGIKKTAENESENFFVYNNGITALVNDFSFSDKTLTIKGISIVNGAQTTGAIGSLKKEPKNSAKIPMRLIKCDDETIIASIVKYNNSQNKVNAPDFRSSDSTQKRIVAEFNNLRHIDYTSRRGGAVDIIKRNPKVIPSISAGQVLAAFHREPKIAYNEKSRIWEADKYYSKFFNEHTTAKHIVLAYSLHRAIGNLKLELTKKDNLTEIESNLLAFLRSRGAIVFFTSAVSSCIEEILGQPIPNLFMLQFKKDLSLEKAVNAWTPVIKILASFSDVLSTGLSDGIKNAENIKQALKTYKLMVSAVKAANGKTFSEFKTQIKI